MTTRTSPVRDRAPLLLSATQWAQHEALSFMASTVKANFAGLDDEQKKRYVELQRKAHAAFKAVETENNRVRNTFKATHLEALKRELKKLTGADIDPEQARLFTRYRELKEGRSPLDVLSGTVKRELQPTLTPRRTARALDESRYIERLRSVSLWDAACSNFGYRTDSVLLQPFSYEQASYIDYQVLADPHPVGPFIAIVRRLDIGSALSTTLAHEMDANGTLKRLIFEAAKASFEFELLEALRDSANSGIDQTAYVRLLNVLNDKIDADIRPMLIGHSPNALLPTTIALPLLFIKFSGEPGIYSYFPQRLGGGVRYHPQGNEAIADFKRQLVQDQRSRQLGWFARQWPLHELAHFQKLLNDEPRPEGLNPLAGLLYDGFHKAFPEPSLENLSFYVEPIIGPRKTLADWLGERQAGRYRDNLSHLARTRSDADWQAFKDAASALGNEVLGMLTTPMPGGVLGLNRIMQFAIFGSLAYSVVQGVIEASKGEASTFASAMADTADMLISGFVAGWASKAHRQRMSTLWDRTGQPRKVTHQDGRVGLWQPDLTPYSQIDVAVLASLMPGTDGIYRHNGKAYAKVEDGDKRLALEVIPDAQGKHYVLKAGDTQAFRPPVVFDPVTKTWRLALDDVSALNDAQWVQRMLADAPPAPALGNIERMLSITATSREQLQHTWEGKPIPGPLAQGIRRLQADHLIDRIINDLPQRGQMPANADSAVLALLTQLEHWPAGRVLNVFNQQGVLIESYGKEVNAGLPPIEVKRLDHGSYVVKDDVTQGTVREEQLFTLIYEQLPEDSRLGREDNFGRSKTGRIAVMREQIADLAKTDRGLLFKALTGLEGHKRSDPVASANPAKKYLPLVCPPLSESTSPLLAKLHELNPSLSIECLEPLVAEYPFSADQMSRALEHNAQPLAFSRAADQLKIKLRVDLALDGIYHSRSYLADCDIWAREMAAGTLRDTLDRQLVVTEISASFPPKPYVSTGPDDTTVELRDYGKGRYEAYDFRHGGTIPVTPVEDSFYLAIGSVMQPQECARLGMQSARDEVGLRTTLGDAMLARRQPNGEVNLWDNTTAQYERDVVLPHDQAPGELGLYEIEGEKYLALYGEVYQVELDTQLNQWRLKNPDKVGVNTPRLEHNGDGAWRQSIEKPMEWSGLKLLRRLRAEPVTVSDELGYKIMAVSNTDEGVLRQVHVNNISPPPLLIDTWKRFRIDEDIQGFVRKM